MVDLAKAFKTVTSEPNLMADGSESFPYLWRYFLRHEPLRAWLMRADPYATASVSPTQASRGIAFCCNFTVPTQWEDMAASFDLGEMFIPDHPYSHFMCGTVVAATSFHKHLVCALGPLASRNPECLPSYQTCVRRMVIDMGSTRSINCLEFSWMQDGALIVTAKILVPPDPTVPFQTAGLSGAFALFQNVTPAGKMPTVPTSLVSFVEVPTCPVCLVRGSLGCLCSESALKYLNNRTQESSSAIWPPRLHYDAKGSTDECYQNIRIRLDMIQHISHVKITAHMVTPQEISRNDGSMARTYKLGPSRFVIKAVMYRPSNNFQSDTLRQVADKLRLLCSGSLSITHSLRRSSDLDPSIAREFEKCDFTTLQVPVRKKRATKRRRVTPPVSSTSVPSFDMQNFPVRSTASSHVSIACSSYSKDGTTDGSSADDPGLSPPSKRCNSDASRSANVSVQNVCSKVIETPPSNISKTAKRLVCPECNKSFSQQGSLNRHLKNIHEESKIPCQYCHMSFGQMYDLQRHQRRKHPERYVPITRRGSSDLRCPPKAASLVK